MRGLNNIQPERTATLWDAETGLLVSDFHGDARADASGTTFLGGDDATRVPGLAALPGRSARTGEILGASPRRGASAMSADATRFAAAIGNDVVVSTRNGSGFVADLFVAAGGARFDPAGRRVVVWDTDNGLRLWTFERDATCAMTGHDARINDVAFSPDGQRMVSVSQDATAQLWRVGEDCHLLRKMTGHSRDVRDGVFAPDGRTVATGSADGTVRFWDGIGGDERLPASPNLGQSVDRLAFDDSGSFVGARLKNGTIRILDAATHAPAEAAVQDRLHPKLAASLADTTDQTRTSAYGHLMLDFATIPTLKNLLTGSIIARYARPLGDPDRTPFGAAFDGEGARLLLVYPDLVRVVRVPARTQALIDFARAVVPRCLTPDERSQAHLPPDTAGMVCRQTGRRDAGQPVSLTSSTTRRSS